MLRRERGQRNAGKNQLQNLSLKSDVNLTVRLETVFFFWQCMLVLFSVLASIKFDGACWDCFEVQNRKAFVVACWDSSQTQNNESSAGASWDCSGGWSQESFPGACWDFLLLFLLEMTSVNSGVGCAYPAEGKGSTTTPSFSFWRKSSSLFSE